MTSPTGVRALDNARLCVLQACSLVIEGMRFRPALEQALADLQDALQERNLIEDPLLRFLPTEAARDHQRIHLRALESIVGYVQEDPSSGYPKLHRILTMVRSHQGSLEEMQLLAALKEAIRSGRLIARR